jgi:hypothetical protein
MVPRSIWKSEFIGELNAGLTNAGVNVIFKEKEMDEDVNLSRFGYNENLNYMAMFNESYSEDLYGLEPEVFNYFPELSEDDYDFDQFVLGLCPDKPFKNMKAVLKYIANNMGRVCAFIGREAVIYKSSGEDLHVAKSLTNMGFGHDHARYLEDGEAKTISLMKIYELHKKILPRYKSLSYEYDRKLKDTFYMSRPVLATELLHLLPEQNALLDGFLDFIREIICEDSPGLFSYFIKWLAFLVKFPSLKSGIAVFLNSKPGTGKSLFASFISEFVLGNHLSRTLTGLDSLLAENNFSFVDRRLLVVNEMSASGSGFRNSFDKLKGYITDREVTVKKLYLDTFKAKQSWEFLMISNHLNSIYLEEQDRRYLCLQVSEKYMNDRIFFKDFMTKFLNAEFGNVFYTYLLSQLDSADDFMGVKCPSTKAKSELINLSMSSTASFANWLVSENIDNVNSGDYHDVSIAPVKTRAGGLSFKSSDLYKCFCDWCGDNNEVKVSAKKFKYNMISNGFEFKRYEFGIVCSKIA